jgi:peptidoglycan hydrolase CwlO-like protein
MEGAELYDNNIFSYIAPIVTGLIGWFSGRRKQNNDFLNELQASVSLLSTENKNLMAEVIQLRKENANLMYNQETMKLEIGKLRQENETLRKEIEQLNNILSNVKTITKKA